jgi:hypothetical protein
MRVKNVNNNGGGGITPLIHDPGNEWQEWSAS